MADMNDPRIKKMMQQLMSRPETLSSMDVEPETDDSADMALQAPVNEEAAPEEEIDVAGMADMMQKLKGAQGDPSVVKESDIGQNMQVADPSAQQSYQGDPSITAALRKLKAGQPVTDDVEVAPETIEDPSADPALRKAALEKVKQKYLGR